MLGLHNAAPSIAYSLVNVAPSSSIRSSERSLSRIQAVGEFPRVPTEGSHQIAVATGEPGADLGQRRPHLLLVESQNALEHRARPGILTLEGFLPGYVESGDDPGPVRPDAAGSPGHEFGAH